MLPFPTAVLSPFLFTGVQIAVGVSPYLLITTCFGVSGKFLGSKSSWLRQWQRTLGAAADFEQLMLQEVGFCRVYFSLLLTHRKRQVPKSGALIYCRRASLAEDLGSSVRWCKCIIFVLIKRFMDANTLFPVNIEYISSLKPVLSAYKPLPLLRRVE